MTRSFGRARQTAEMLKRLLKNIVALLLRWEAILILNKYRPKVVGITGNIGKTSAKDAIYSVVAKSHATRRSEKSYNSEIGVPLSILGCPNAWGHPLRWLDNLITGLSLIFFRHEYPKWLILEIGADRPGDIKTIAKWLKLDIAVITALPEKPVHQEYFKTREELIEEKLSILNALRKNAAVVINHDDVTESFVGRRLAEKEIRIVSYGLTNGASFRASQINVIYDENGGLKMPTGLSIKVDQAGNILPLTLPGLIGPHQIYAPLAALAIGFLLNINLIKAAEALTTYQTPPGRLRLIAGVKNSLLLDDTYNSSPAALIEALKTLKSLEISGRKIAVIGDMLELGSETISAHQEIGDIASEFCQYILTVGPRAKFIYEAARAKKFPIKQLFHFSDSVTAGKKLEVLLGPGDVALIKGSQSMRMEKTVEEAMADPANKANLLCRQDKEWLSKP